LSGEEDLISLGHPHKTGTSASAHAAFAKKAATAQTASAQSVALPVRLLNKHEILTIVGVTYPTVWKMMRDGRFPRSRVVGGKSVWRSDEVDEWLANLPTRTLKGDKNTDSGPA
jgi:predicted DNA-binding transcriptional regulator AlpA